LATDGQAKGKNNEKYYLNITKYDKNRMKILAGVMAPDYRLFSE